MIRTFTFAAALATLAVAAPAQAFTKTEAHAWGNAFGKAGVRFISDDHCAERDLLGLYQPESRTITVCTNNIPTLALLRETIAHEAIHAAQHCVGRRLGVDSLLPIHTMLASSDPELAYKWQLGINEAAARKSSQVALSADHNTRGLTVQVEREAYAMESRPDYAIQMLRAACIRK